MYYVILKKDRNPHEAGFKYGPVSKEGYIALYNDGYIDDTENLIEKKKLKIIVIIKKKYRIWLQ